MEKLAKTVIILVDTRPCRYCLEDRRHLWQGRDKLDLGHITSHHGPKSGPQKKQIR